MVLLLLDKLRSIRDMLDGGDVDEAVDYLDAIIEEARKSERVQ